MGEDRFKFTKHKCSKWTSAAVACIIVIMIVFWSPAQSGESSDLPKLMVNNVFGDFGFEGYMAYDIDELYSGNPWSESDIIETLPVFQNPTIYDEFYSLEKGLSGDEMMRIVEETASIMGLKVDSICVNPTEEDLQKQREKYQLLWSSEEYEPNAVPQSSVATCGDVTIEVKADGLVRIFFEEGIPLPDEYHFTSDDTTGQQAEAAMKYLLGQYAHVVDMKSPALALFGDYNIYAQRTFSYVAYENSGSLTERILGYNFNRIKFSPNDEGLLWVIDRSVTDVSQKIGDYPVITAQGAREMLIQKQYITTVPEDFPGAKYIAGVELMYRTSMYDSVFMPYYRFFVEMPTMRENDGMKTFGAFYVPAISKEFLTDMPLWGGGFN